MEINLNNLSNLKNIKNDVMQTKENMEDVVDKYKKENTGYKMTTKDIVGAVLLLILVFGVPAYCIINKSNIMLGIFISFFSFTTYYTIYAIRESKKEYTNTADAMIIESEVLSDGKAQMLKAKSETRYVVGINVDNQMITITKQITGDKIYSGGDTVKVEYLIDKNGNYDFNILDEENRRSIKNKIPSIIFLYILSFVFLAFSIIRLC